MKSCLDDIRRAAPAKSELRGEISPKQPAWLGDVVRDTLHRERGTVKAVAATLGVTEHAVYDAAGHQPQALRAWWIPAICRETGSFAILDALEAQVGRVAFALPAVNPHLEEMNREFARTVKQFGAFIETNGDALADGILEDAEVRPLVRAIDSMIADLSEYRALVLDKAHHDATAVAVAR